MINFYKNLDSNSIILLSLGIILMSSFAFTRITKKFKLPYVTGYIIGGILIGPSVLNLIPHSIVENLNFVSDIALSFIAFSIGKFLKKDVIKETGASVILIALFETVVTGFITFLILFLITKKMNASLLLAVIAMATSSTSTLMTIKQYHARGEFVNTSLQLVAIDNIITIFSFSIVLAIVNSVSTGESINLQVILPILYNILVILIGCLCGVILSLLITPQRSLDNRLIILIAMLLGICGICSAFEISPLLSCMAFGIVYINKKKDSSLHHQLDSFMPPIMSLFFVVSGMNLNFSAIKTVGLIGVAYCGIRMFGKWLGSFVGCLLTGQEKNIRKHLGLSLIPQASVAIGLVFLAQRVVDDDTGNLLLTVVLASSVISEIVGPACTKNALVDTGTITQEVIDANGVIPK